MIILVFVLLSAFLLVNDSFVKKIKSHKLPGSCILCPLKRNTTYQTKAEILHFSIFLSRNVHHHPVDVLFFFVHANNNPRLKRKFNHCLSSLLKHATPALHLHILTDHASLNSAVEILKDSARLATTAIQVSLYDVNIFMTPLEELINTLVPHFSFKPGAYYSDGLFYISVGLFKVMNLKKVIVIDADVKFLSDIKLLYEYFDKFPSEAIIGIAREQQPVYRHILHEYRRLHNGTRLGDPPPDGITGFNSGVLLLDLDKMRNSSSYLDIINNSSIVLELIKQYKFRGHLGDQDFYTLVSFEYPDLFYILPCTWNRQLCKWWKYHGYQNIFDLYYSCPEKANILHGNCNSIIPDS
ncbi:Xyloside xylosyltransferase 1 like protein [Argiope bruennichi]|uniref:Xyloside xylosyltransferase 1 like protein n=2 Tax=Argiope bruennichi TaxID=94029 RepID=A0A8T0ELF1_ARGBR|nr:Xyloside xylosyltransferase 1 like protein [Argiope bruennichi]